MPLSDVRRTLARSVAGPLAGLATGALVVAGLSGCGAADGGSPAPSSAAPPRGLQGPPLVPRVLLRAGARVTCPTGAEPAVVLERAEFRPGLVGGTRLTPGPHRITVTGSVTNETNSPVQVLGVVLRVGGRWWPATVSSPSRLGPGEGRDLVAVGGYRSPRSQQARVRATLRWRWVEPRLRPCGDRGLLNDD